MTKKTLLTLLAHPDDESFGPGGTFARYAREGVDVHIIIATDGAAGSIAEGHDATREKLVEIRAEELRKAVQVLGATLHSLGYQDSGMRGDEANAHPAAFINSNTTEAVGRMVKFIRQIKPNVVVTHDETGGYFHPDHIRCWEVATAAFHAAADATQYPELGLPPHQAERLYYTAIPKNWVWVMTTIMRLRGYDPTKMGRNKDIDFTKIGIPAGHIHAHIDIRSAWEIKREASAHHASQGGGTTFGRLFPTWLQKQLFGRELFIRAYPPVPDGFKEKTLFP